MTYKQKQLLLKALNYFEGLCIDTLIAKDTPDHAPISVYYEDHLKNKAFEIISRNIQSIEKQIKKC